METKNMLGSRAFLDRLHLRDFVVFIFFALVTCPLMGQDKQKSELSPADYDLWSLPEIGEMTNDGKWLVYKISYAKGDTLTVKATNGKTAFVFPSGHNNRFIGNRYFTCQSNDSILNIVDLKSGLQRRLSKVIYYDTAGNYLIVRKGITNGVGLDITDLNGRVLYSDRDVYDFAVSPDKRSLMYSKNAGGSYSVYYVDLSNTFRSAVVLDASKKRISRLTWSTDGKAAAFVKNSEKASELCYYRLTDQKNVTFAPMEINALQKYYLDPNFRISFAPDNNTLFFRMRQFPESTLQQPGSDVQVWNAADKFLYTHEQLVKGWTGNPKIFMFKPESGDYKFLTDPELPQGFLTADKKYAISYNIKEYEPQERLEAVTDYYITSIASGSKSLMLQKSATADSNQYVSPEGNRIFYFQDNAWHCYKADSGRHQNLTPAFTANLYWIQYVDELHPYGLAGVTADGRELLFYDEFDLWAAKLDGSGTRRLTKGREKGIVLRAVPQSDIESGISDRRSTLGSYDLANGIVLSGRSVDNFMNGVFFLKVNSVKELRYTDKSISNIVKAKQEDTFAWIEEQFNSPPMVVVSTPSTSKRVLRETNPQHRKYFYKAPEVLNYSWNGKQLHGILYYPVHYKEGTKYPMVLHIYEKQSQQLNKFLMPGNYNSGEINVCNLTAKGYFVLLPDIEYKTGYIGDSALHCVEAAVDAALQNKDIDSLRIGLSGSSFGGFETNYIITKSKTFACAIAGCAPTDYVSNYLSEAIDYSIPNYFKMEQQQGRMGGSLYDNMEAYLRNSPVLLASGVSTPLLSWTGLKDFHVHYTQSFEFYMALRRLGKEHILLGYPDEGHGIIDRKRDADLTLKMEQWLDYYLKGKPKQGWMLPN